MISNREEVANSKVMQVHSSRFKQSKGNFLYNSMRRQFVNLRETHRDQNLLRI